MNKKVIYIAHPIGGDVENNIKKVLDIVGDLNRTNPDVVPFAPYIVDCLYLNDEIPSERQRGIENNISLFKKEFIDEVWLYGTYISKGMKAEINLAESLGINVIDKTKKINNGTN